MECKNCGSKDLVMIEKPRGIHNSLYCGVCLTFQKFLSKRDVGFFKKEVLKQFR